MGEVLFSVVIPAYNIAQYLEKCVQSVISSAGELHDFEIIIVDDGSTDSTPQAADALAEKNSAVRVVHQKNLGLSGARNAGIIKAQGQYILLVDGDDTITAEALPSIRQCIEKNGCPDVVISQYETIDADGNVIKCPLNFDAAEGLPVPEMLAALGGITSSVLFCMKRTLLTDKWLFFEIGLIGEDDEWASRMMLMADSIALNRAYCYRYLLHREGSIMTSTDKGKDELNRAYVLHFMWMKFHIRKYDGERLLAAERYMRRYYIRHALEADKHKHSEYYKDLLRVARAGAYVLAESPALGERLYYRAAMLFGVQAANWMFKAKCAMRNALKRGRRE